jgi:hypothetical protein
MLYEKATVENGQVKILESKEIDQSSLTSDCWLIQFEGAKACEKCEYKNKRSLCGGMRVRSLLGVPSPVSKSRAKNNHPVKFHWLSGGVNWLEFGGKWISNKLNNGEFDYWLVLSIVNLIDAAGKKEAKEKGGTYFVSLDAISPSQISEEDLKRALENWGMEDRPITELSDEMKVELLQFYGTHATLWFQSGNNARKLLKKGRWHAQEEGKRYFKETLDQFANRLGNTHRDFLKGDLSIETAMKNRNS